MYTQTSTPIDFIASGEYPGDGKPKPVSFQDPAACAVEIDGAKVITLPQLVDLKLASGMTQPERRRRDLADIQDLIRILRLDEQFAASLNSFVQTTYLTLLEELSHDDPHRS